MDTDWTLVATSSPGKPWNGTIASLAMSELLSMIRRYQREDWPIASVRRTTTRNVDVFGELPALPILSSRPSPCASPFQSNPELGNPSVAPHHPNEAPASSSGMDEFPSCPNLLPSTTARANASWVLRRPAVGEMIVFASAASAAPPSSSCKGRPDSVAKGKWRASPSCPIQAPTEDRRIAPSDAVETSGEMGTNEETGCCDIPTSMRFTKASVWRNDRGCCANTMRNGPRLSTPLTSCRSQTTVPSGYCTRMLVCPRFADPEKYE